MGVLKATFTDSDGSLSIPELSATAHAVMSAAAIGVAIAAFVHDVWMNNKAPDYVAFGTGIAAMLAGVGIIGAALGAAQRLRDGQMKQRDGDGDKQ